MRGAIVTANGKVLSFIYYAAAPYLRLENFYYSLDELSWFKSMTTVGVVIYEGRCCYRLHGINNWAGGTISSTRSNQDF